MRLKMWRSHLPASEVVVDLDDQPPSGVQAMDSKGRPESLHTRMKADPRGGVEIPHTGATRGMATPLFATNLAVL